MAKALLGQYAVRDDRLALEAAKLRSRVHDLQTLVDRLQVDNDRLRAELVLLETETSMAQPV
jgi:hypothetical protein